MDDAEEIPYVRIRQEVMHVSVNRDLQETLLNSALVCDYLN